MRDRWRPGESGWPHPGPYRAAGGKYGMIMRWRLDTGFGRQAHGILATTAGRTLALATAGRILALAHGIHGAGRHGIWMRIRCRLDSKNHQNLAEDHQVRVRCQQDWPEMRVYYIATLFTSCSGWWQKIIHKNIQYKLAHVKSCLPFSFCFRCSIEGDNGNNVESPTVM